MTATAGTGSLEAAASITRCSATATSSGTPAAPSCWSSTGSATSASTSVSCSTATSSTRSRTRGVDMPWFPDFVSAGELARRQTQDAGHADPVGQYLTALNDADTH